MSKGIVKSTPLPTRPGSLSVTEADPNPYKVSNGATLEFANPGPAVTINVDSKVEFEITSATTGNVLKVL